MQKLTILNTKEKKELLKNINEWWDASFSPKETLMMNSQQKIYVMNNDLSLVNTDNLRINNAGLYIGQLQKNMIRLSIEGSQLIGPSAKKHVIEIPSSKKSAWLMGADLEKNNEENGFSIVKCGDDFLGCGLVKDDIVENYVGKNRRVSAEY